MNLLKHLKRTPEQELPAKSDGNGLSRFRREVDHAFERAWRAMQRDPWTALIELAPWPAIDVEESDQAVTLRVDVPGLDPGDFDVKVSGNQLTICGARNEERTAKKDGMRRHERYAGEFTRTLTLPSYVDAEKIQAHHENGVLRIIAPKIPREGPKRVVVQSD